MKIESLCAFKDNYIWVLCDKDYQKIWVVDPGEAQPVLDFLIKTGTSLAGILLTHHHHDHSGGIPMLLTYAKNIPVYASENSPHSFVTNYLKNDDEILCGSKKFKIISIPGHTLDHIAFFDGENLFCGDILFSGGCGRVFEGTYEQMYHSLEKLLNLPEKTKIYCGHEYTLPNLQFALKVEPNNQFIVEKITTVQNQINLKKPTLPSVLKEEKNINPFLRCDKPNVIKAAENYAQKKLATPVEVFTCVRQWKNAS